MLFSGRKSLLKKHISMKEDDIPKEPEAPGYGLRELKEARWVILEHAG